LEVQIGKAIGHRFATSPYNSKRVREDRITLKTLRAVAKALDCDLVYALVPRADRMPELIACCAPAEACPRSGALDGA
jgi:hypothetical protein